MRACRVISWLRGMGHPLLLSVGSCLGLLDASGQGLHNATSLHLQGAAVYIDGQLNNTGVLVNDGQITFTSDWNNAGLYGGGGILEAGGRELQTLTHNDQPINTLLITGSGEKYINGKITITGALNLSSGIVHVSEDDALRLVEGSALIGGSSHSYIDGALTAEGTGYRFFPIGKNGQYAPLELLDVRGEHPVYSVEAGQNALPPPIEGVVVFNELYWQRKDIDGYYAGSPVRVGYDIEKFTDSENIVLLAGSSWQQSFETITALERSEDAALVSTSQPVSASIIMFGERAETATDQSFYFSTALSPAAANPENRAVRIFGQQLSDNQFRFSVFNRFGSLVYESTSLEDMSINGWDGRSPGGRELATGAYPYRLTAVDKSGKRFERKGVITIIR